jgi:hypothetical protein
MTDACQTERAGRNLGVEGELWTDALEWMLAAKWTPS